MNSSSNIDYKKLFSELIKKQLVILGPDITFAKVGNVVGLKVDINGDVQSVTGDPQAILQELINQFVDLSNQIVKKTMESMLATSQKAPEPAPQKSPDNAIQIETVNIPPPTTPVVSALDQRIDPTVHEVVMPISTTPKASNFSKAEVDNLNKVLTDLNSNSLHDSFQVRKAS